MDALQLCLWKALALEVIEKGGFMKLNIYVYLLLGCFFVSTHLHAARSSVVLETDWLETEQGSRGVLGTEVTNMRTPQDSQMTIIDLAVPVEDTNAIDQIEVLLKDDEIPLKQVREPLWMEDLENGKSGLRLFLKRKPGFEFQLRLIDEQEE